MPHHKSAVKRLKTNERDRVRNMAVKSSLRKSIKEFREAAERTPEQLSRLYQSLDKAARKGVLPPQRVDRLKSRLANLVS